MLYTTVERKAKLKTTYFPKRPQQLHRVLHSSVKIGRDGGGADRKVTIVNSKKNIKLYNNPKEVSKNMPPHIKSTLRIAL